MLVHVPLDRTGAPVKFEPAHYTGPCLLRGVARITHCRYSRLEVLKRTDPIIFAVVKHFYDVATERRC